MVWNFSLSIAGPFFAVYQVEELNATPVIVGILSIVSSLAGLPALRLFGRLNDRLGAHRTLLLSGLLIPLVPVLWIFTRSAWHPLPINLLAGFLWAGYSLASFNLLLSLCAPELRARYSALFQLTVMISAAVGAAAGGFIVQAWGFPAIFILSGIGRVIGLVVFWRTVRPPAEAE
jgi:predicted MFS family arabinose efflux permease